MDSSRDTELRYSAVEQYIRSLPYLPDAWDFNGETLTVVSGGDITTIPYENTQTVMAAEDVGGLGGRDLTREIEDNEDFTQFSQADEKRDPLEEREDQQFFLSVSLVPGDYFVKDMERVQQDVQEFLAASTHMGWRPDEHLIIAADQQNNEIDILIHSFGDMIPHDKMVELHTLFTEVFGEVDVSGYVYADFVEPLIETHYPFTYGYPAARQAMMARAWESESFNAEWKLKNADSFEIRVCANCGGDYEKSQWGGRKSLCEVCCYCRECDRDFHCKDGCCEWYENAPEDEQYSRYRAESFAAGDTIQFPCFYCGDETLTSRGILYYRAQLPSGKWGSVEVCEPCLRKQHENRAESFAAEERARDKKGRLVPKQGVTKWGNDYWPYGVDFQTWKYRHPACVRVFAEGWGVDLKALTPKQKDWLKWRYEEDVDSKTSLAALIDEFNLSAPDRNAESYGAETRLCKCEIPRPRHAGVHPTTCQFCYLIIEEEFEAEGDEYVCCVCGRTRTMADGSDFPYWAHEVECEGPALTWRPEDDCDCDLMICSERCDEEGLAKGDFHYPLDAESFAAEGGTRWIELDPVMIAKWLSSPPSSNPTQTPPIWTAQEAQLLLEIMQQIEDYGMWLDYRTAQDLLAIAARDGPAIVLNLHPKLHTFDAETVVFEARPTTMKKIREKYVEIWEGTDYAEKDEDDDDYGLPHQIASTLREIDEKSEIKEQSLEWICNQFAATDPTTDELWDPKLIWPEDLPRALDVWKWYAEEKKDPRIQNKFRELFPGRAPKNPLEYSIEDIEDVMDATTPESEKSAKNERWNPQELGYDPKIAKEILNKDGLMVVEINEGPGAAAAASKYASGTRWCTSSPSTATYYLKQGPLYVVFQNGQKFAQIHSETNQVCDLRDRNMDTLPEHLSQFMFDRSKKNYDEKHELMKSPTEVREHLVQLQKDELTDRIAKENAKLKSLQTRFGDPDDTGEDPIRALIVKPYVDEGKMDQIKRTQAHLSEKLESDPTDLVSDSEVERWIIDQERTLGEILTAIIGYREASEGVKPDNPELRKRMYEVLEERAREDSYHSGTYGGGETFGKALGYFMGDGKRNAKVEEILMNVKKDHLEEAVFATAGEYYVNPQFAGQWSNDDRWMELESALDPEKSKYPLVKKMRKKGEYNNDWADAIKNYLLVGGHQNNPSRSSWENAEPDIWRWPTGFLLIMGNEHPAQGERRRKINEILGVALERYKKGHQEQMPEALAKKVIPNLAIPDVLEYAAIFPEHLTQGVKLPVVEKSATIQDVAIELIEMVYGKDSSRDWRGNRHGAEKSNLDAWPDGEERIMEYIQTGGELTPEIVVAFELVIEPKLDAKMRRIRESNTKGGMKPPAQKGYPCSQCLENLSWSSVKPGRLRKLLAKGQKKAWVNAEGKTKCRPIHGWNQEEQDHHELMIPSTLLVCDKCQGWRPVAKIRKDSLSWQDNRFIQNAGSAEKKCKCTFRKDNIALYEAEGVRQKCGNCRELGHTRRTCTNEPVVDPVDPRKIEDFEPTVLKESKMARGARVKRNIRRLLAKLGPLTRSGLSEAYQAQSGARIKPRQDMRLLTRMANADKELIEWRDRYYILGPGGKQEFFMTGPGSLGLREKKSAEGDERPYTLFLQVEPFGSLNLDIRNKITDAAEGEGFEWIESTGSRALFEDGDLELLREIADDIAGDMGRTALVLRIKDPGLGLTFIEELETLQRSAEGNAPAPFGEIDAALADAMARTHQRIAEVGNAMDEILQKHGGSYEAAEVDPEYLKLASEYAHLSRAILRIQNVMRD